LTNIKYESSHPWLTFRLETARFSAKIWILLGEATSKFEHLAGVPLTPAVAQRLYTVYLAKGARATTAIEGNTLTEEQVEQLLENKLELPPSKEYLKQEVDNIIKACNAIAEGALGATPQPLRVEEVEAFNKLVLNGLNVEPHVVPGEVRECSVGVSHYKAPEPEDCKYLLKRLVDWLGSGDFNRDSEHGLVPVVLGAIIAHLYIAWIHPFGDGNGRTARLVEFALLARAGVPLPAAHLLSNHYNETRSEYYRHLDMASRDRENGVQKFVQYSMQGLVDGLRNQIEHVKALQLDVAWENYVHQHFRNATTAQKRQRDLILELSRQPNPVAVGLLPFLTPEVTKLYAADTMASTLRKLRRDLVELYQTDLVVRVGDGLKANKDVMKAFLPPRAKEATPSTDGHQSPSKEP